MSITFNANEILEMAEEIERNGVKFYTKAAESESDEDTKKMLLELAEMEANHEKIFAAMQTELTDTEKELTTFDPDHEAALYLQAMADGHVFDVKHDPSEQLTGHESVEDIIMMALQAEKDSIAFYLGLKKLVPSDSGKNNVEHIIAEEMAHIATLSGKLSDLR
jgi:rubrerythrin